MAEVINILGVSGGLDATVNHTSKIFNIRFAKQWGIQMLPVGLSKNYKISLEISNNETDWSFFKLENFTLDKDVNEFIFDTIMPGKFFRVQYDANGNTAGTIRMLAHIIRLS